jgi:hypothetical protein
MTHCNPVEEVVVDYWFEHDAEDGTKTIHAFAIDGRIFMLTKPNPSKLAELKKAEAMVHHPSSGRRVHHPEDGTEPKQD